MGNMKPILFNTDMVRALLDGRKTVTRRPIKDLDIINSWDCESDGTPIAYIEQSTGDCYPPTLPCPYQDGDILWVRETWMKDISRYMYRADYGDGEKFYRDGNEIIVKWHPSIHMPREAARLFLRVTAVRVERLRHITYEDCRAEGIWDDYETKDQEYGDMLRKAIYQKHFATLWNSTIKPADLPLYGWAANPWVWVIEFERISSEEAYHGQGV